MDTKYVYAQTTFSYRFRVRYGATRKHLLIPSNSLISLSLSLSLSLSFFLPHLVSYSLLDILYCIDLKIDLLLNLLSATNNNNLLNVISYLADFVLYVIPYTIYTDKW